MWKPSNIGATFYNIWKPSNIGALFYNLWISNPCKVSNGIVSNPWHCFKPLQGFNLLALFQTLGKVSNPCKVSTLGQASEKEQAKISRSNRLMNRGIDDNSASCLPSTANAGTLPDGWKEAKDENTK